MSAENQTSSLQEEEFQDEAMMEGPEEEEVDIEDDGKLPISYD